MRFKNKKMIAVIIIVLVVIEISTMFLMYKSLNNKKTTIDKVTLNKIDKKAFAVLLEQADGTYLEVDSWPNGGYVYNSEKSGCMDENGNKIDNAISFDESTNLATLNTNKTTYCYLYFKIESTTICTYDTTSTVAKGLEGAKYNCKVDSNKAAYTFYLIDNNEDGTSDLIMNANINASGEAVIPGVTSDTGMMEWLSSERYDSLGGADLSNDEGACEYGGYCASNLYGPVTAMEYLHNATKSWSNVEPLTYTYNDRTTQGITSTTIGYESFTSTNGIATITAGDTEGTQVTIGSESEPLRARMPIYSSDASITEVTSMTNASYLYDNLDTVNYSYAPYGYWTLSSSVGNARSAWYVYYRDGVNSNFVASAGNYGVRPVITLKI